VPAVRALPALLLVALALGISACGSGSSETTSGTTAATGNGAGASEEVSEQKRPAGSEKKHESSGSGAEQFESKGGDNSIQKFGSEVRGAELDETAAVLHAFLDARAARDWAAACERLSAVVAEQLVAQLGAAQGNGGDSEPDCATVLAKLVDAVPNAGLREAAVADIGAFRAEGDHGFLLFHGADGGAYFMPMAREDGRWKVAAVAASPLL
jgi:hypothetical protein